MTALSGIGQFRRPSRPHWLHWSRRPGTWRVLVLGLLALALPLIGAAMPARAVTIERVISPKMGIEAWLVRDHTIPVISVQFAFRGGAALDPKGKAGLADMVSGLLDEGAGKLDSEAFQKRLADLSIGLSFSASLDYFGGNLRTLSENRDAAFGLLKLALTQPRFDPQPVTRIRDQILAILARSSQDPNEIASRAWFAAAFPHHPYGRPAQGTAESVKTIKVADLRAFAAQRLARDNLLIGVAGDITADELARLLDETFGDLPKNAAPDTIPEVQPNAKGGLILIKRDIPQSVVVFGQKGVKRNDPDYYTAYVMNYIEGGGGFSSRLTEEVREKRGLAYSVYTYLQPMEETGLILGGVATANPRLGESLDIIRSEWARLRDGGVTAKELADAKTYLTGSFPLKLDSTSKIARVLVSIQIGRLGIDYLDRHDGYINAVTQDEVRRVAKRLIDPDALSFVVVGSPKGVTATRPPVPGPM